MNAGKLIAQIAALAIIVYCSYSAVISAIPLDPDDLKDPLKIDMGVDSGSESLDGLNLKFTVSGSVTSRLPQDIKDVGFAMYLGSGSDKINVGSIHLGSIKAKDTTVFDPLEVSIPVYAVVAFTGYSPTETGFNVPLCTEIEFKYLEWQESHLIDLGIIVKANYEIKNAIPHASTYGTNGAKVTVDVPAGTTVYDAAIDKMKSAGLDDVTLTCNGSTIHIGLVESAGITSVSFEVDGNMEKTAYQLMKEYMTDHEGVLSFHYMSSDYEISSENASAFVDLIEKLYKEASA